MRKYAFARGNLKVLSSLYQNFTNSSSSIHTGKGLLVVSPEALQARIEKSEGMNSFLAGKCKEVSIAGGSLHNSINVGEISSSTYCDPNHGSQLYSETKTRKVSLGHDFQNPKESCIATSFVQNGETS